MTETTTPERLVASLTTALDEEEAAAKAATPGPWHALDGGVQDDDGESWPVASTESARDREDRVHIARQDPARTLRRIAAHREILDRYAETLRDYAYSLKRARGGPIGNADLDDFEAELPVLRSIVEIIAGIYEEPTP